jgi:hypothetical protein
MLSEEGHLGAEISGGRETHGKTNRDLGDYRYLYSSQITGPFLKTGKPGKSIYE